MKTTFVQRTISGISIAAFSIILTGQIVQAETNLRPRELNKDQNTTKQSVPKTNSSTETTNSANFPQHTSASDLNPESTNSQTLKITQSNFEIEPGTATRSSSSYIGIGGNIGLSGDTTIGNGAFAVISKIGLTDYLSARPSALIDDDAIFLLPVTFDFSGDEVPNAEFSIAPYLGGGLAISTGRDDTIGPLISGGLDIPLSSEFTANAGANVSFIDDTDVGLTLGVGYNFQN
ncbi:MAG: hypothetical protein RLZZ69_3074 [Cyanobacteriota bacterium]|jgi:hypothetical protein